MSAHLQREMERLTRQALEMCANVEQNFRDASRAFLERDPELARKAIDADLQVDKMESELSENCLKILALHQPVAGDLRLIVSLAKIAGMLERIGDLAENLARKARSLARKETVTTPPEFAEMVERAGQMLRDSIDSLVAADTARARKVIVADHEVDSRKRTIRKAGEAAIMANPGATPQWLTQIAASRNVERVADMAVNIAAEVIYSVDGVMVRHGIDTAE